MKYGVGGTLVGSSALRALVQVLIKPKGHCVLYLLHMYTFMFFRIPVRVDIYNKTRQGVPQSSYLGMGLAGPKHKKHFISI